MLARLLAFALRSGRRLRLLASLDSPRRHASGWGSNSLIFPAGRRKAPRPRACALHGNSQRAWPALQLGCHAAGLAQSRASHSYD